MTIKHCTKCKIDKSPDDFGKKGSWCKKCVNDYNAEYRKKNQQIIKEKQAKYRVKNDVKIKQSWKKIYYENHESRLEAKRDYRRKNLEKVKGWERAKRDKQDKEKVKERFKDWSQKRDLQDVARARDKVNVAKRERRKTDIGYRIASNASNRVRKALRSFDLTKENKTIDLLECNVNDLRAHLESQFEEGMFWENYGDWHIDHILPCNLFDLSRECEQKRCFHYTNLQPLWGRDNIIKSDTVSDEDSILTSIYLLFEM